MAIGLALVAIVLALLVSARRNSSNAEVAASGQPRDRNATSSRLEASSGLPAAADRETPNETGEEKQSKSGALEVHLLADEETSVKGLRVSVANLKTGEEKLLRSDEDGTARAVLPVDRYRVSISEPGYEQRFRTFWLSATEHPEEKTEVELEAILAVEVTIEPVDEMGRPIPEAQLGLRSMRYDYDEVPTDDWILHKEKGAYRVRLSTGTYLVQGNAPGFVGGSEVVEVDGVEPQRARLVLPRRSEALTLKPLAESEADRDRGKCVLRSDSVQVELNVTPKRGEDFAIRVSEVPLELSVPGVGAPTSVEVYGALHFRGESRDHLVFLTQDVASANEFVRLERGTPVSPFQSADGALMVTVELEGAVLSPMEVPCSALTLDRPDPRDHDLVERDAEASRWWAHKAARLIQPEEEEWEAAPQLRWRFRSEPSTSAPEVTFTASSDDLLWNVGRELRTQAGWILLELEGNGLRIRGWVRQGEVLRTSEPLPYGLSGGGQGRGTMCGSGGWLGAHPRIYKGPASVAVGTIVESKEPGSAWAIVTGSEGLQIHHVEGDETVELQVVPGISFPRCSFRASARVPLEAVTLPEGAEYGR